MSAKTCADKTPPTRGVNKKKSGCGGIATVKRGTMMAGAAAHDCCLHKQAAEGGRSSIGCASPSHETPSESATYRQADEPGKRVCKGDNE
ncbi:hypothetical protein G5V57_05180 [Nordella sp. HKS 07]|uniref:hypothetical protein n=1 Tax=Nordella sp. HKS 07 TaxID=2712222 RepID=UPI0013E18197|nr:hypothetical protein [Nordella sp. HKS 07]QIG47180.1 hypothetical protein G5V57_05180 [Nordella sp. HKS 07]